MLTQARVRELFDYREDGELIRKVNVARCARIGDVAGYLNNIGYKVTKVDGKSYLNHRLIWLWHHGYLPEHGLDHIDRNKVNNRIENLREVSHSCNMRNCKIAKNNSSGVTGVSMSRDNKWYAQIRTPKQNVSLGLYPTLTEAAQARWEAEVKYGFPNCNSTSSAFLFLNKK
jgi:hypothetical protein